MRKIPKDIAQRYPNGARGFKAKKRRQLREVERALRELRMGCAYFPLGPDLVVRISYEVETLKRELSVEEWGR